MKKNTLNRADALKWIKKIKIKTSGFNLAHIVILISLFIILGSLTLPWMSIEYNNKSYWAFSHIVGITWFTALILIMMNVFIIFSTLLKQKIKLVLNYSWNDSSIYLGSAIILLLLWIQTLAGLKWLKIFSSDIEFHSWIVFFLIGSILFVFGSIVNKKLIKEVWETYITNNSDEDSDIVPKKVKNTTKLPF